MKKFLALFFAIIAWFAVITQLYLMIENRVVSMPETILRFFSFFTILTNLLVAIYFTASLFLKTNNENNFLKKPGVLTAITVYITIVGLVYQFILRSTWHPVGMQRLVDELLHSVIPLLVIFYWFLYERHSLVRYGQVFGWLVYPLCYLIFILVSGSYSSFYPYPFVDVGSLGMSKVLLNSLVLLAVFTGISGVFVFLGKLKA